MKKVFIIHGFGGVPNGGWLPWLMSELEKKGVYAASLPMPNTNYPVVSEWTEEIAHAVRDEHENIFLVGHSLGVPGVLHYLQSLSENKKVAGVLLVSGVIHPLDVGNAENSIRRIDSFVESEIDFEKIKSTSKKFTVIHGTNDTVVPFSQAEELSQKLGCELRSVEGGDHFSQKTAPICYELPQALTAVTDMISSDNT